MNYGHGALGTPRQLAALTTLPALERDEGCNTLGCSLQGRDEGGEESLRPQVWTWAGFSHSAILGLYWPRFLQEHLSAWPKPSATAWSPCSTFLSHSLMMPDAAD